MPRTYQAFMDEIIRVFPDALIRALNEYEAFTNEKDERDKDKRDFKSVYEYHKACKAIISHIELLLKLAILLKLPDLKHPDENAQIALAALIKEARTDVDNFYRSEAGKDE